MDWKVSHIFQEIGFFDSKYRQVSWKALFSFQIGNSALGYINIQLNQYYSKSLFKLASLRHKIPLKSVTSAFLHNHDATASQRRLRKISLCAAFHE